MKTARTRNKTPLHHAAITFSRMLLLIGGSGLIVTRGALEAECNEDVGKSCRDLASMWKNGQGGKKDLAKARIYYEIACEKGEWVGCMFAGKMWRNGEGGPADERKAKCYFAEEKRLTEVQKDVGH